MNKFSCIDLFAGCGGITEGFESTGVFHTVAAIEWQKAPVETLRKRLQEQWGYTDAAERVLHFDLQKVEELLHGWTDDPEYGSGKGLFSLVDSSVDAIVGGPPCQAYSVAGRIRDENGMQDDYRNYLFESYVKLVDRFRPKAFIFENVPGMLSAKPGGVSIVHRITEAFSSVGYTISKRLRGEAVFDCADFGVPQQRKRVIILGVRNDAVGSNSPEEIISEFYLNLRNSACGKVKTAGEALSHYPKLYPGVETKISGRKYSHFPIDTEVDSHTPRYHNSRDIDIFRTLAEDIASGRCEYTSAEMLKKLYTERTGKSSNVHKYHVIRHDSVSNTIPAHLYKDGLRHIHPDPEQARSLTVREAAALQSFPDDFIFVGSMGDKYKMIGNAVPPAFAHKVATAFHKVLVSYYV